VCYNPAMIKTLDLTHNWTCDYFELGHSMYEFMQGVDLPSLNEWSFDKRRVEGWAVWLQRSFFLERTEACVSYVLYIDSAPASTRIFVNGEHVMDYIPPADDAPPFEIDVTPYVHLDDNTIAFRVEYHNAETAFAGVCLQPVPCD
jgi:hypothetical protein